LIEARAVDRLELAIAPILLGSEGIPLARWRGPAKVDGAVRLDPVRVRRKGRDLYLSGKMAYPES
jgi:riboflavin biosynthesis pyrimidine reductase